MLLSVVHELLQQTNNMSSCWQQAVGRGKRAPLLFLDAEGKKEEGKGEREVNRLDLGFKGGVRR